MTTAKRIRWEFERLGLSYRLWAEDAGIELLIGRLKRSGQELQGELRVKVNWDGVKTVDGTLHQARFNVSSVAARGTLAKHLKTRTEKTAFEEMDWCDALEHLCQFVLSAEREGEPLISMNGAMPERRHRYDIKPLCPHGVVTFLYGPGGLGKSIVATAIAASIAKGMEIIPGLAPQVKGPALYLDYETDSYTMRERVEYISNGHQFKTTKDFYYRRCNRPLADDAEEVARLVKDKGIKFVVVDSCGPAMGTGGDYGDANEGTLKLFSAIRLIGATTLVVDHVAKTGVMKKRGGEEIGATPYGSVYKINLARATWELQNGTVPGDDDIIIRLVNTKANDARLYDPIDLSIVWDSSRGIIMFTEAEDFSPEEYAPTPEDGQTKPTQKVAMMDAIANSPDGLTASELASVARASQKRINNIIREKPDIFTKVFDSDPPRYRLVKRGGMG